MPLQRQTVLSLREKRFVPVKDIPGLELEVVPAEARLLAQVVEGDATTRQICSEVFVGFRGYLDGANEVPNSLDARLELWTVALVQQAVRNEVIRINNAVARGEAPAASGSPAGPSPSSD